MAGVFDFLHIKRHTAGSSNELSFDVLEAASDGISNKKQKSTMSGVPTDGSRGNYHGFAGTSTLSAVPEVEKRKQERRNHVIRVRVLGVLLLVAAIAICVYFAHSFIQSRASYDLQVDSVVEQLSNVDKTIVTIDSIMEDPLNTAHSEERASVEKQIPQLKTDLQQIKEGIDRLVSTTRSNEDVVALTQLNTTTEQRGVMVDEAKATFELAADCEKQAKFADETWQLVVSADQIAREAAQSANSAATAESIAQAREQTSEAYNEFTRARTSLENMELQYERLDFADQKEYLDKRIESLEYALATADALVSGDREEANRNNDAYNEADASAASMAEKLPASPASLVRKAFEADVQKHREAYEEARETVTRTDSDIRSYLSR